MLPSDLDPIRPPMAYKLSIGEVREKNGKTFPSKQDYFTIRRLSAQAGQSASYIIDQDMQARLCKAVGVADKPRVVPVSVIGNPSVVDGRPELPPSILWSRMAYYWGAKCVCACGEFGPDGTGTAIRKQWEDVAHGEKKATKLKQETTVACDPKACPLATGLHTVERYYGTPLCKPQIAASFVLPFAPTIGTVAVLKTTGWKTYAALRSSLITIAESTNGWLHRVPLNLVYGYGRASDGKLVPALHIEFAGDEDALLAEVRRVKGRYLGQMEEIKRLEAGVVLALEAQSADPVEEAAFQAEFAPEGDGQDVTDAEFVPDEETVAAIRAQEAAEYQAATRLFEEGEE